MNPSTDSSSNCGLRALELLPTVAAPEFMNWRPDRTQPDFASPTSAPIANPLSKIEERFLRAVIEYPGRPSSAYPSLAGIGTHQAIAARKRLIETGFLREHRIQTAARGRTSVVLEAQTAATAGYAKEEN